MKDEPERTTSFDPIEEILEAVARGEQVVMADDERRENEGDLIFAAAKVTDEAVNFMTKHGRGLICVALDRTRLQQLGLSKMTMRGAGDAYHTAFMDSVDAATGISTGISAHDRARTIQILVDPQYGPDALVSPGHTFPLQAVDGGVLHRAGHTEAAVDLARLAGLPPAGVICEILQENGQMARLPQLIEFARAHKLKIGSIADLIAFRRRNEQLVEFVRTVKLPTPFADFDLKLYHSILEKEHHVALVLGEIKPEDDVLVRVHSECLTGDVFGSQRCDCGNQLVTAMERIAQDGKGVLLYLRQEGRGIGLANKIHAYALQEDGLDTVEANEKLGFEADLREYGVGAQILYDIGVRRLRLLTNNPRKVVGLQGYGMEIVERVPVICTPTVHSRRYLATKKARLGHLLD